MALLAGIALSGLSCLPAAADEPAAVAEPVVVDPSAAAEASAATDASGGADEPATSEDQATSGRQVLALPFPFYNENFGLAVGGVYGITGYPDTQSRLIATAFAGTRGSAMVFLAGQNLRTPFAERLFIDPVFSVGYFKDTEAFINGNPHFADEQAGTNKSNSDNFIHGAGLDYFARSRFKYLAPIGDGRDQIIPDYEVSRGLLIGGASGGHAFDPLTSGRTFLSLRPFYRNQQIDSDDIQQDEFRTNGLDAAIFWDNRDFPANPARGQGLRFQASQDFGLLDSNESWTALEGEADQYIDLGETDWFRQRVIALDVWTAYSPSWDQDADGVVHNRAPSYTGATLGGLWRMRGYPSQRFSDKAAIYYAAELRLIPEWNPFDAWPRLQQLVGVDWIQFVPFAEVGRVAPEYDVANLHSSMKVSGGLGLRAMAKGFVIRADAAGSPEGFGLQMMISQPFQF